MQNPLSSFWAKLPIWLRAIVSGLVIGLSAANMWPLLLLNFRAPLAAIAEAVFLAFYLFWAAGGGPPRMTQMSRAASFRRGKRSRAQWFWGGIGALFFAVTVHASIVLLFRFVAFPLAAFRRGYDLSFIPGLALKWLAVVVSAASAGICEETGFRGYMQAPMEKRYGAPVAIFVSSLFFTAQHLSKGWATPGMIPIVFGAGVPLGLVAWSSGSLIPGMVGYILMDVGLFAYWWTGIAGNFAERPVVETGVDPPFVIECMVLAVSLLVLVFAIWKIRKHLTSQGFLSRSAARQQ